MEVNVLGVFVAAGFGLLMMMLMVARDVEGSGRVCETGDGGVLSPAVIFCSMNHAPFNSHLTQEGHIEAVINEVPCPHNFHLTALCTSTTAKNLKSTTMPSDDTFLQQAEEWKAKGNESFGKENAEDAISFYSNGIVACDRMLETPPLKATILSNRAACYLKLRQHASCKADCTMALESSSSLPEQLRSKLLFRRAKALAALQDIQDAAKDCMAVLQIDPHNKDTQNLLTILRAQHKTASTPVAKILQVLDENPEHQLRLLLGLVDQDLSNTAQELARLGGLSKLLDIASTKEEMGSSSKAPYLALQVIRSVAGNPKTLRSHMIPFQEKLTTVIDGTNEENVIIGCLAIWVRLILHADRDDPACDITGTTVLNYQCLLDTIRTTLEKSEQFPSVLRAVFDVMSTWMAGADRDSAIRAALAADNANDPLLPIPKTPAEVRAFTPQELAAYKKRQYDQKNRDQAWAYERSRLFCDSNLRSLLTMACTTSDATARRECTVAVSRIMSCILLEDDVDFKPVKDVVAPLLESEKIETIIEEVFDEDEKEELSVTPIQTKMERALLASALLLAKKETGIWAMNTGWSDSDQDLPDLISSGDLRAMGMASELLSAAATVEGVRGHVSNLDLNGLLRCGDRDIRSGAAAAIAKLGLSEKATKDEGEMMGLLQAACELLGDQDAPASESKDAPLLKKPGSSMGSFATTSIERAIEMISYLATNTTVKEELAAGFSSPGGPESAIAFLVETADKPSAGDSLSGYALATIFQNISATNEQLRKEAFEGKEVTMEQYDEMQRMGKTDEEKEVMDQEKDPDTLELCYERIRQMAKVGVPRALVALTDGASEHTLEQVVMAMNRMANEASVRGVMIQQGALSACIKVEKKEGPTDTDVMKKIIRLARHCIAKMLVTTNPSLLTSAQRLGSIKPLLQLLRDIKANDLQHFESLMSLTNIASSGEDAMNRIVTEKGIPALHYAMFSDHEKVRQAATEAMCNLVQHKAMIDHLSHEENLKLWLAFAVDYEENYGCARAAAGCLAMATSDVIVAQELVKLEKFRKHVTSLLESGRLEIMQRILVAILNLVLHGEETREKVVSEGLVEFCRAYIELQNHPNEELQFSDEEKKLLPVTVDIAKEIVKQAGV